MELDALLSRFAWAVAEYPEECDSLDAAWVVLTEHIARPRWLHRERVRRWHKHVNALIGKRRMLSQEFAKLSRTFTPEEADSENELAALERRESTNNVCW